MLRLITFISLLFLISCKTERVVILDGDIIKYETYLSLTKRQDTVEYITLHNGEVISQKEFNKRWNKTVSKTTKRLKKK